MWIFGLKRGIQAMLELFAKQVVDSMNQASTAMNQASAALDRQSKVVEEHGKFVNTVVDKLEKTTAALGEQLLALKRHDEKATKVIELLGNLEKRMNGYSFTAVECQGLVGELRAMRVLLDDKGQFRDLDKPARKPEDILR